ncbi:MAG TPA: molecular chaperone HtpG [Candidatus Fimadaptatus faecigallinarum]|uniref:Molecular chaperone HtpG n=1 Tax=Candidatus Fimadaptatus faecigallinarum TaxID=2840814 RepID=A0A9D1LSK3_9FIRM|nr:molecular chaperone HtpG [Candidatus Fimadaptatus faecigallinarum]
MSEKKGTISIHAQNIMPIIKKWLYSDKDIFVRELVSNGCDAIAKYKLLASRGEVEAEDDYAVYIEVDKENKVMRFIDNGVGMTADEVEKYITQVAFSGATEFIEKYKGDKNDGDGIIGHFGLGFYSAFMAVEKVQIDTLSWQKDAQPVRWVSSDGMEYDMSEGDRTTRGSTITLYMNEDSLDFLEPARIREVLDKYCAFMPIPIYLNIIGQTEEVEVEDESAEPAEATEGDKAEAAEGDKAESKPKKRVTRPVGPKQINDTHPLWLKMPKDVTDDEYKAFYHKVFHDYDEPLFWIHLNADYPFNLKGILYFPKLKNEFTANEGQIKLFSGQVFVADNIKEVIPEFLMLLKGVIDCSDLPLNVSRSFLQNDGYVQKMAAYITRKVADRLVSEFENNREQYQGYWSDINPFVKYGCIKDKKFYDRVKGAIIFKTVDGEYLTLEEYKAKNPEKQEKTVYYCNDAQAQAQAVELYKQQGITVVLLDQLIDGNFISFLEYTESGMQFKRVDSDVSGLTEDDAVIDANWTSHLEELFRAATGNDKLDVELKKLKSEAMPAMVMVEEQSRRFTEMSKRWGGGFAFPEQKKLVLNTGNALVQYLATADVDEKSKLMARQVYDLAEMGQAPLDGDAMLAFVKRSYELLALLADANGKKND